MILLEKKHPPRETFFVLFVFLLFNLVLFVFLLFNALLRFYPLFIEIYITYTCVTTRLDLYNLYGIAKSTKHFTTLVALFFHVTEKKTIFLSVGNTAQDNLPDRGHWRRPAENIIRTSLNS
jgi:hypothetical protein